MELLTKYMYYIIRTIECLLSTYDNTDQLITATATATATQHARMHKHTQDYCGNCTHQQRFINSSQRFAWAFNIVMTIRFNSAGGRSQLRFQGTPPNPCHEYTVHQPVFSSHSCYQLAVHWTASSPYTYTSLKYIVQTPDHSLSLSTQHTGQPPDQTCAAFSYAQANLTVSLCSLVCIIF